MQRRRMLEQTVSEPRTAALPSSRAHAETLARRLARPLALDLPDIPSFLASAPASSAPSRDAIVALSKFARRLGATRIDALLAPEALYVALALPDGTELPTDATRLAKAVHDAFGAPLRLQSDDAVSPDPMVPSPHFLPAAANTARAWIARIRSMELESIRDKDPEGVHEFRIASRRLRAVLRAIHRIDPTVGSVIETVREIGRIAGNVRDFDVVTELLHTVPLTRSARTAAIEHLSRAREPALVQLQRVLTSSEYAAQINAADALLAGVGARGDGGIDDGAAQRHVRREMKKLRERMEGDLAEADGLHAMRRQMRKVRDAVDVFGPSLTSGQRRWRRRMHPLQTALGRFNDLHVALGLLSDESAALKPARKAIRGLQLEARAALAPPLAVLATQLLK